MNEYLIDLIEFLQKHFRIKVSRTRIDEEGGAARITLKNGEGDLALEISAAGAGIAFALGDVSWRL